MNVHRPGSPLAAVEYLLARPSNPVVTDGQVKGFAPRFGKQRVRPAVGSAACEHAWGNLRGLGLPVPPVAPERDWGSPQCQPPFFFSQNKVLSGQIIWGHALAKRL